MLVAIIDTGIQLGIFPTGPIIYDMEVTHFGIVRKRKGNICSFHGAFVAAILEKYAPGCCICSIKIFDDETHTTTSKKLCSAFRWCQRMSVPIINVSAGIIEASDFKRIARVIDALTKNRQIVVAAYNKNGMPTMPAGHEGVIGVRTDSFLFDTQFVLDKSSRKQDYIASSQHNLTFVSGAKYLTPLSVSFAVPTITAALVNANLSKE